MDGGERASGMRKLIRWRAEIDSRDLLATWLRLSQ